MLGIRVGITIFVTHFKSCFKHGYTKENRPQRGIILGLNPYSTYCTYLRYLFEFIYQIVDWHHQCTDHYRIWRFINHTIQKKRGWFYQL
jgi:hypothetical protein